MTGGDEVTRGTPATGRTIAEKLDHLIRSVHPADRGPLSYMEIAEAIREKAGPDGPTVSHATIQKIRKGEITDPKVSTLTVIAGFFGVPVAYFLDDTVAERVDAKIAKVKERVALSRAQQELVEALRDSDVRDVAVRMNGLSVGSLHAIRGVIEQARRLEGLPDPAEERE
ncbi:helix-turn-helix transcriptional regulator [Streptomyces alkaliterrae]|uniref:Helix-turn-helix transcriptional regulator n=1 Tax=Streptomyces alkaliterrae TaxID=2213162 RepID=A0A5P0YN56_9ACTN|nr:helix-turn-helix transcriptional regulator [Streptomyces alkaliterrae]MBB1256327.1 helix-turn-helix transcriptional regulator [Streptomyces alkaliterrae]MBB1262174.1 helix-turn-helix transcriptional regulator [Streptomyces alkaliterrae]MQS01701.1 XRE family transcriptional regulator [Streptomyces alkaliterrae]